MVLGRSLVAVARMDSCCAMEPPSSRADQLARLDTMAETNLLTHDEHGVAWHSASATGMVCAPVCSDEAERIAALRELAVDTTPNAVLDDLTLVASDLTACECAAVALVDVDRVWFKSHVGLDFFQWPRAESPCAWTILSPPGHAAVAMVVRDTRSDRRFADNRLLSDIRSYVGVPLVSHNNQNIGAFCAFSSHVVEVTAARIEGMQRLAHLVMRELEHGWSLETSLRDIKQLQHLSHQLRTPLHSIVGHSQLLLGTAMDAEQVRLAGNILESADDLTHVVTTILQAATPLPELAAHADRASRPWENFRQTEEAAAACVNAPASPFGANEISRIQQAWQSIAPIAGRHYFQILFELDPALRELFPTTDRVEVDRKLMLAFETIFEELHEFPRMMPGITLLAHEYAQYGVCKEMFATFRQALLLCAEQLLGVRWTAEVQASWSKMCDAVVAALMENNVPLTSANAAIVQRTWTLLSPNAQSFSSLFYRTLFDLDPLLRPLFPLDLDAQRAKLMQTIALVVRAVPEVYGLVPVLHRLGRMHARIGVTEPMYGTVCNALLSALERTLGVDWNLDVRSAWHEVLKWVCTTMIVGTAEAAFDSAAVPANFSSIKVLNVDDNAMNRSLLSSILSRLGVTHCVEVANGKECLDKLAVSPDFDCVFLDLQMPVMGGTAACLHIRKRMAARRPFLAAVTADSSAGVAERCRAAGFDKVLSKPCSMRSLREALEQALAWRANGNFKLECR